MITRPSSFILVVSVALMLGACGGGGGGGGGGVTPPPPPPPATVNYTVTLSGMTLTDMQTGTAVPPSGLPVAGATATRTP